MSLPWYANYYRTRIREESNYLKEVLRYSLTAGPVLSGRSELIVSLTSFPARIHNAWIAIESIFRQTVPPDRIVLVLSTEEFQSMKLPRRLREQEFRGLEIVWVKENTKSYKKLLPVREKYSISDIVTVDDDIIYKPDMLENLINAKSVYPGAIVGHRGWEIKLCNNCVLPYSEWSRAGPDTPRGRVMLTGSGGTLYPPWVLNENILMDYELAQRLCPTADDIYFWAVSCLSDAPVVCLGNHSLRRLRSQLKKPKLSSVNVEQSGNDDQMQRVMSYFSLEVL